LASIQSQTNRSSHSFFSIACADLVSTGLFLIVFEPPVPDRPGKTAIFFFDRSVEDSLKFGDRILRWGINKERKSVRSLPPFRGKMTDHLKDQWKPAFPPSELKSHGITAVQMKYFSEKLCLPQFDQLSIC